MLFERGGELSYATSTARGAAAFTVRRAACTVGRTAGATFFRWSDTGVVRRFSAMRQ